MSKVFAIHRIDPRPGVAVKDFEQFLLDTLGATPQFAGWKTYMLKGDRGGRENVCWSIIRHVETRNRYFPSEGGQPSDEAQRVLNRPDLMEKWNRTVISTPDLPYTDYVALGQ
jgi:hypothetical protein